MRIKVAIVVFLPLLAACASNKEYRQLASSTGIYVQMLNAGTAEFIKGQEALNRENADRLDAVAVRTNDLLASARRQEMALTVGGGGRELAVYRTATIRSGDTIVTSMAAKASRAAPLDDAGAADAYNKASDALAKLSAKPGSLHVLAGILTYADAINTAYDGLKEKASEDAEATDAVGVKADTEAGVVVMDVDEAANPATPTDVDPS